MFLAIRDLRRGARRFALLGAVIALVAVLSTVLSGLATGLVTDGTPDAMGAALDRLVRDPVLAKRLGAAGRDRVKDLRWEQVVETLLGGAPR